MRNGLFFFGVWWIVASVSAGDVVRLETFSTWSRSGTCAITSNVEGSFRLEAAGEKDFCAQAPSLPVEPGDLFELTCLCKHEPQSNAVPSVVLYHGEESKAWVYGAAQREGKPDHEGFQLWKSTWMVPPGVDRVVPRVVGSGNAVVTFRNYTLRKLRHVSVLKENKEYMLENRTLRLTFSSATGAFQVQDKRSGRLWTPALDDPNLFVTGVRQEGETLTCELFVGFPLRAILQLDGERPELIVRLMAESEQRMTQEIAYPYPFASGENERLILPLNEGISYPTTAVNEPVRQLYTYGGHGLCMAFWGQTEETFQRNPAGDGQVMGQNGWMVISETPDDGGVWLRAATRADQRLTLGPYWVAQCGQFGYERVLRYVFFTEGGHVAMAKRYREYAQKRGLYVPFREKIRRNPALKSGLDKLRGAVNVWYFAPDKVEMFTEMQAAGIERILSSAAAPPDVLKKLNAMPNVLTSRYDIYQDLMDPEVAKANGLHHGSWTQDAWPHDIILYPDGQRAVGWSVDDPRGKEFPRIPCAVLCDSKAPQYAEKRIANELKTHPYAARFIDTSTAAAWRECYHPDHPMNRSDSKQWRMKLLAMMGERFHLVCGCETGHDASVPYCDFYEGMMSLGPYRVHDSGRYLEKIWDKAPPAILQYQVGEAYRLPLWELVYHDCTVSYWYWGDYSNKLPEVWRKRDLFNALYGVPPMYLFNRHFWDQNKDRFVESYQIAEPVSRLTGYDEMTNHRILTEDRTVQQTEFANGVRVSVNFGHADFVLPDGYVLPAQTSRVETGNP